MSEKVMKKKIKPYPIDAAFTHHEKKWAGQIVKLVPHGFLVETGEHLLHVSQQYDVVFTLPVLHKVINSLVQVVKTYDQHRSVVPPSTDQGTLSHKSYLLVEMHFINSSELRTTEISRFLRMIGQS